MNLGKPLTAQLIFTKTKSDSLHNIKNLNLWGNDLEDLSLIEKMPSLEVVSLSVNRISSLKYFVNCTKLQELYLRKNNIADIRQIRHLVKLPALRVLWLHDNPCSQVDGYRMIVIKCLPNLIKLDNFPVTPEEKTISKNFQFSLLGDEENYRTQPQQHQQSYSQEYRNQNTQQKWQRPSTAQSNSSQKHSQPPSLYFQQRQYNNEDKSNRKNMQRKSNPISNPYSNQKQKQLIVPDSEQQMNRNQNILMAILSLMRQLDPGSLQIVRREADRMLE